MSRYPAASAVFRCLQARQRSRVKQLKACAFQRSNSCWNVLRSFWHPKIVRSRSSAAPAFHEMRKESVLDRLSREEKYLVRATGASTKSQRFWGALFRSLAAAGC